MTDVHEPTVRSYNMSRIKGKDTKPELLVRKFLYAKGCRYRLHDKNLPGKPDLVFRRLKTVVFIHGCFWHAHKNCKYFVIPKTKTEWWKNKIYDNSEKDFENEKKLAAMDWKVITVWECELKSLKREETLKELLKKLKR